MILLAANLRRRVWYDHSSACSTATAVFMSPIHVGLHLWGSDAVWYAHGVYVNFAAGSAPLEFHHPCTASCMATPLILKLIHGPDNPSQCVWQPVVSHGWRTSYTSQVQYTTQSWASHHNFPQLENSKMVDRLCSTNRSDFGRLKISIK